MLTCKQVPEKLLDPKLTFSQKVNLKFHLFICERCRRLENQFKLIQSGLKNIVKSHKPLDERLAKKIADDYLKTKK